MAYLTSCWFIVETVIIPDGLIKKWFCLSFFIHPLILFFCQIFLWLKLLIQTLLCVLLFPFRAIYVICLCIFRVFKKCIIVCLFSLTRLFKSVEVDEDLVDHEYYYETQPSFDFYNHEIDYFSTSMKCCKVKLLEFEEDHVFEDTIDYADDDVIVNNSSNNNNGESLFYLCDVSTRNYKEKYLFLGSNTDENSSQIQGNHENMFYPSQENLICGGSNSQDRADSPPSSDFRVLQVERQDDNSSDGLFYKIYAERMRWFDVLNYERTCGMSAIMQNKEIVDCGVNKISKTRLLRSIENDFEMVYVAQSCLSWEILNHQYKKVKEVVINMGGGGDYDHNNMYCSNVATEFQKFQVVLERFMEDEQCEGKRVWNFVRARFSLKSLLQVPAVSVKGLKEYDKEEMRGEGTNLNQVLKAIEDCIQAFSLFVKTDDIKKPWWKIKNSPWAYPPVEDPRDLELLAQLNKRLQKNKLWMKDLEGKKRCLVKRVVKPLEECEKEEMLLTMIDLSLVSRVLQMSMVSSSHLKWCQQKLHNIEFKDGKVVRTSTHSLFPP
uniref:Ribosomal protein L34Ae n=1 Tax=Cannabis sativa TaxID=3483 RepID=A0A803RC47_CANSA